MPWSTPDRRSADAEDRWPESEDRVSEEEDRWAEAEEGCSEAEGGWLALAGRSVGADECGDRGLPTSPKRERGSSL